MTLTELADRAELSVGHLSSIERNLSMRSRYSG